MSWRATFVCAALLAGVGAFLPAHHHPAAAQRRASMPARVPTRHMSTPDDTAVASSAEAQLAADGEEDFVLLEPSPSPQVGPGASAMASAGQPPVAPVDKDDDEDDPLKQARVLFYMGISVAPVLFLLPFLSSQGPLVPLDPSQM